MPSVLITGASRGIGAALAEMAAADGWRVALGYNTNIDAAETVAARIGAQGGVASAHRLPLDDTAALEAGLDALTEQTARLDAVVLNASPAPVMAPLAKQESQQIEQQFRTNVLGHQVLLTQLWKRYFRPAKAGHIVAVLSAALRPPVSPYMAGYIIGKAGFDALLQASLAEYGRGGLALTRVWPNFTATGMLDAFEPRYLEMALRAQGGAATPPEAVAHVLLDALNAPPQAGALTDRFLTTQPSEGERVS